MTRSPSARIFLALMLCLASASAVVQQGDELGLAVAMHQSKGIDGVVLQDLPAAGLTEAVEPAEDLLPLQGAAPAQLRAASSQPWVDLAPVPVWFVEVALRYLLCIYRL